MQIYGSTNLGYYYINAYVGSPSQVQTLIVDTGSWLTAFPCNECQGDKCGLHLDNPFNMKNSISSRKIECGETFSKFHCNTCGDNSTCVFEISYSEGSSIQGFYVEDIVNFKNDKYQEQTKFLFGCTTQETNLFITQKADGILGLGIDTNEKHIMPNIIDFYYRNKNLNGLKFSLCISNLEGGFLSFGDQNLEKHLPGEKTFTVPISRQSGQYNINIYSLKIGNRTLDLNHKDFEYGEGVFVDSGTTLFYSHHKIHIAIIESLGSFCAKSTKCQDVINSSKCFLYDSSKFENLQQFFDIFPTLQFELDDGFLLDYPPQNYLFNHFSPNRTLYCLPFEEISNRVVFGAIAMRNYDIEFDRENKKLHFTKSNCSKDFESDLNPKHQNKILQESHWPRILEINNNTNLSNSSDFNVILSNDSNNNTNNNNQTNEVVQDGYKDPDGKNKMILGICVILLVLILVLVAAVLNYIRKKRNLKGETSKMIPKDNIEAPPRSDYEKPAENSRPNQIVNPIPIGRGNKNIYQIDENDISNSIDINYEINMDINNPNMHFSNINFENIDRKKIVNNSDPAI